MGPVFLNVMVHRDGAIAQGQSMCQKAQAPGSVPILKTQQQQSLQHRLSDSFHNYSTKVCMATKLNCEPSVTQNP